MEQDELQVDDMQVDDLTPASIPTTLPTPIESGPEHDVPVDYDLAHRVSAKWEERHSLVLKEFEDLQRKGQGNLSKRRQRRSLVLRQLLEAQVLLASSIDQMRDCLLRYRADGYHLPVFEKIEE
jgi:hypothetical protein